jgi:hypothetical protein
MMQTDELSLSSHALDPPSNLMSFGWSVATSLRCVKIMEEQILNVLAKIA